MIYDSEIIDSLSARPPLSRRGPLNDSSGFAVEAVASGDRLRGFCGESRATLRRIHNASAAAAADDGTRLARSLARGQTKETTFSADYRSLRLFAFFLNQTAESEGDDGSSSAIVILCS